MLQLNVQDGKMSTHLQQSDRETCFCGLIGASPWFFCWPFLYKITPSRRPENANCWNQVPEGNLLKTGPLLSLCKDKICVSCGWAAKKWLSGLRLQLSQNSVRHTKNAATVPKIEFEVSRRLPGSRSGQQQASVVFSYSMSPPVDGSKHPTMIVN